MPSSRWSCRCGWRWSKDSALHSCLQPDQGGGVRCGIWVQGKVVLLHPGASGMMWSQLAGRQLESMIPMRSSRSGQAEWYDDHPSSHPAVHKVWGDSLRWTCFFFSGGQLLNPPIESGADLIYWWSKAEAFHAVLYAKVFDAGWHSEEPHPADQGQCYGKQLTTSPIVDDFIAWTTCLIKDKYLIFTVSRYNYIFVYTSIYDVPLHLNVFGWF